MMSYICVGIGVAAGAIARVALSRILPSFILNIPLKILCVNVIGCFVMGNDYRIYGIAFWMHPHSGSISESTVAVITKETSHA